MLSNYQLLYITSHHECTQGVLDGVYSIDLVPTSVNKFPAFWIVNEEKSNQKGSHWVSCFFESANSPAEFFCSLGREPNYYSSRLVSSLKNNGNGQITRNSCKVQADETSTCAYFCLYVLDMRCRGMSYVTSLSRFSCSDMVHNERVVATFMQKHMTSQNKWCFSFSSYLGLSRLFLDLSLQTQKVHSMVDAELAVI